MSLTFIGFAVWAFGLSIVGLLNESRPHLAAIVISHALAGVYGERQLRHLAHTGATLTGGRSSSRLPGDADQALSRDLPSRACWTWHPIAGDRLIQPLTYTCRTSASALALGSPRSSRVSFGDASKPTSRPLADPLLYPTGFWKKTLSFQLGVAIVQPIGTLLIALVAWKLADQLKWTTFRKTGADRRVARAHTLGLLFELALLVAAFFIVASQVRQVPIQGVVLLPRAYAQVALSLSLPPQYPVEQAIWLHELFTYPWHTSIRTSVPHLLGRRYRIFLLVFTVLLAPLLVVGWLGVKRKSTWLMMGFCAGKVGFL